MKLNEGERPKYSKPLELREEMGPFVYFIRQSDYVKIGTSINPQKRLEQLARRTDRTHKPEYMDGDPELVACIPGSARDERILHARFADQRARGEWFWINQEIRDLVLEAAWCQIDLELAIAGEERGSATSIDIWKRKFGPMDRMAHEHLAFEYDHGHDFFELMFEDAA